MHKNFVDDDWDTPMQINKYALARNKQQTRDKQGRTVTIRFPPNPPCCVPLCVFYPCPGCYCIIHRAAK